MIEQFSFDRLYVKLEGFEEGENYRIVTPGENNDYFKLAYQKMRSCYKLTPIFNNYVHKKSTNFGSVIMSFASHLEFPQLKVYISSEESSYGVEFGANFDGTPFELDVKQLRYTILDLKPTKSISLEEKRRCSHESFWTLMEPTFVDKVTDNCPKPCSPLGTPNRTLKLCETSEDWECANEIFSNTVNEYRKIYTSPCTKLEYNGRIRQDISMLELPDVFQGLTPNTKAAFIAMSFEQPETVTINEEYLVYGVAEVIGAVGGTIGLFTGFHLHLILMEMISYLAGFSFKMMKKVASYGGNSNKVNNVHPKKIFRLQMISRNRKMEQATSKSLILRKGLPLEENKMQRILLKMMLDLSKESLQNLSSE